MTCPRCRKETPNPRQDVTPGQTAVLICEHCGTEVAVDELHLMRRERDARIMAALGWPGVPRRSRP